MFEENGKSPLVKRVEEMGMDREIKKNHIKFGKIGVLVNFFIQKLKIKHLDCLSLLL